MKIGSGIEGNIPVLDFLVEVFKEHRVVIDLSAGMLHVSIGSPDEGADAVFVVG